MDLQGHWNNIFESKQARDTSWYQPIPRTSLELIKRSGVGLDQGIIDVGGGESFLIDQLLAHGYSGLAVLDISEVALRHCRNRLVNKAEKVQWFGADVTSFISPKRFGLWHDRAVFHFLVHLEQRTRYLAALRNALRPGGTVVLATFATDGPKCCSGLEVIQYDEVLIQAELGAEFELQEIKNETHLTPWEAEQEFVFFRFLWNGEA